MDASASERVMQETHWNIQTNEEEAFEEDFVQRIVPDNPDKIMTTFSTDLTGKTLLPFY